MPIDNINEFDCNYIKEMVTKIDKLQKEVTTTVGEVRCIGCDASLYNSANNTIPVSFLLKCGTELTGRTDLTGTTTNFFRIESVRCQRFVTLRLLVTDTTTPDNPTLTATTRTMVVDLDELVGIECYEPITVEVCQTSLNS